SAFLDQQSRIYRVFEYLETGNRMTGTALGGRVPGRININTIWDGETLLALCDPQPSNSFSTMLEIYDAKNPTKSGTLFDRLIKARTPFLTAGRLDIADQPFVGMAPGFSAKLDQKNPDVQYPDRGLGISDTFLRLAGGTTPTPLFAVPNAAHPAQQLEVMTKIFNNLTTRSNVFAVWLTVGFFEVVDDTTQPVKLGAEIGRAENRNTRHRMFAIVDRTNLNQLGNPPVFLSGDVDYIAATPGNPVTLDVPIPTATFVPGQTPALAGMYEDISWQLKPGDHVNVDFGPLQEKNLQVKAVTRGTATTPPTVTLTFKQPHPGPITIYPSN